MALSASLQAIRDRLKSLYNARAYGASSNPGGFSRGGSQQGAGGNPEGNFIAALRDVADYGQGLSDLADQVEGLREGIAQDKTQTGIDAQNTNADREAINATVLVAAKWAAGPEDQAIPGTGGLFSALHYMRKALGWADTAENVEVQPGKFSARHWAARAATYAAGLNMPAILAGDGLKFLRAKADRSGYELVAIPVATQAQADAGAGDGLITSATLAGAPGYLKVGDVLLSRRPAPANYLRADGSKFLKSAYPAAAPILDAAYPFDTLSPISQASTGGGQNVNNSLTWLFGDLAVYGYPGGLTLHNHATGQTVSHSYRGSYYPISATVGADGKIYLVEYNTSSTATYLITIDPANIATAPVELGSTGAAVQYGMFYANGFYYCSKGNKLYRNAVALNALNSNAETGGLSINVSDMLHVGGNVLIAARGNSAAEPLMISTDNGANWSVLSVPLLNGDSAFSATSNPNFLLPGSSFMRFGGTIYVRLLGNNSNYAYIYAFNPANNTLSLLYARLRTVIGAALYFEIDRFLFIGGTLDASTFGCIRISDTGVVDEGLSIRPTIFPTMIPSSDNLMGLGLDNFGRGWGRGLHHPTYGFSFRNTTSVDRMIASHNKQTEFRTPILPDPVLDAKYYVRAA